MKNLHKHALRVVGRDTMIIYFACSVCPHTRAYYRMTVIDSMLDKRHLPPIQVR